MVRCVVKSCMNCSERCLPGQISFFRLPENAVMREGWIQKIGEMHAPKNIKCAKICSVHFTEDSFVKSKRNRGRALNIRRRLLLPNAVPTLFLSQMENSDNKSVTMDFKVIYKDFPLPIIQENIHAGSFLDDESDPARVRTRSKGISEVSEKPKNINLNDSVSVQECMINIKSSKGRRSKGRIERYERLKNCRNIRRVARKAEKKRNASKRRIDLASREIEETGSEESTPSWKCKQRFMLENCAANDADIPKTTQENEPGLMIEWPKSDLQRSQSVCEFYKQSKSNDLKNLEKKQEECDSLKLELQQKNEELQKLCKEKEELINAYKDLVRIAWLPVLTKVIDKVD